MPTDIKRIKHPFKNFFLSLAILFIISSAFLVKHEDLYSVSYVKDFDSSIRLCCVVLNIISLTSIFQLLFAFGIEQKLIRRTNILLQCWEHVKNDKFLVTVIVASMAVNIFTIMLQPNVTVEYCQVLRCILIILCFSAFLACLYMWFDYDDADLALSQDVETSIGALWAFGAYTAFYKKVLLGITARMRQFETENNLRFVVKKLVIICPLSCNVTGSLADQCAEIEDVGHLEPIPEDEGANLNRYLKNTVYRIRGQSEACIAAELSSPLGTLWEARESMNETIQKYHRDCFIHKLKNLVRHSPCIVLVYDDQNPKNTESLDSFLLSRLQNHLSL